MSQDIRRNITITWTDDAYYEPGDSITIVTQPLIDDAMREFVRNNRPITKVETK